MAIENGDPICVRNIEGQSAPKHTVKYVKVIYISVYVVFEWSLKGYELGIKSGDMGWFSRRNREENCLYETMEWHHLWMTLIAICF